MTAYEMRISDWSSDVCSSDLLSDRRRQGGKDIAGLLLRPAHIDPKAAMIGNGRRGLPRGRPSLDPYRDNFRISAAHDPSVLGFDLDRAAHRLFRLRRSFATCLDRLAVAIGEWIGRDDHLPARRRCTLHQMRAGIPRRRLVQN